MFGRFLYSFSSVLGVVPLMLNPRYYAKRCMLALAETLAKNMVVLGAERTRELLICTALSDEAQRRSLRRHHSLPRFSRSSWEKHRHDHQCGRGHKNSCTLSQCGQVRVSGLQLDLPRVLGRLFEANARFHEPLRGLPATRRWQT